MFWCINDATYAPQCTVIQQKLITTIQFTPQHAGYVYKDSYCIASVLVLQRAKVLASNTWTYLQQPKIKAFYCIHCIHSKLFCHCAHISAARALLSVLSIPTSSIINKLLISFIYLNIQTTFPLSSTFFIIIISSLYCDTVSQWKTVKTQTRIRTLRTYKPCWVPTYVVFIKFGVTSIDTLQTKHLNIFFSFRKTW